MNCYSIWLGCVTDLSCVIEFLLLPENIPANVIPASIVATIFQGTFWFDEGDNDRGVWDGETEMDTSSRIRGRPNKRQGVANIAIRRGPMARRVALSGGVAPHPNSIRLASGSHKRARTAGPTAPSPR